VQFHGFDYPERRLPASGGCKSRYSWTLNSSKGFENIQHSNTRPVRLPLTWIDGAEAPVHPVAVSLLRQRRAATWSANTSLRWNMGNDGLEWGDKMVDEHLETKPEIVTVSESWGNIWELERYLTSLVWPCAENRETGRIGSPWGETERKTNKKMEGQCNEVEGAEGGRRERPELVGTTRTVSYWTREATWRQKKNGGY